MEHIASDGVILVDLPITQPGDNGPSLLKRTPAGNAVVASTGYIVNVEDSKQTEKVTAIATVPRHLITQ